MVAGKYYTKANWTALCGFVPLDAIQYPHVESIFDRKCLNYSYASGGGCVRLQHLQLFGTVRNIPTHLPIGCLLCILGLWRVRNIPTHFQFFSITARSRATCWELVLCLNYSDVEQTRNLARHSHMLFFQGRVPPEGPPPFLNFSGGREVTFASYRARVGLWAWLPDLRNQLSTCFSFQNNLEYHFLLTREYLLL